MKPIVPFLGVLSALWLFLGTWWMSNMVCSTNNASTFSVIDGDFSATAEDHFTFVKSSDKMEGTGKTSTAFRKIGSYLKENPGKQLILTGLYGSSEKNPTASENLGIARAEKMKFVLLEAGASENNIKATSMEVNNLSFNADQKMIGGVHFRFVSSEEEKTAPAGKKDDEKPSSSSNSSADKNAEGELSFSPGNPAFLAITKAEIDFNKGKRFEQYVSDLSAYLKGHPDKKLIITVFNNDKDFGETLSRRIKSAFKKEGLGSESIGRKVYKESSSPKGTAGITLGVE